MVSQKAKVLELYLLGQYMTLISLKLNAIMEISYNGWHPVCLCGLLSNVTSHSRNMLISRQASTGLVLHREFLFGKKLCLFDSWENSSKINVGQKQQLLPFGLN